MEKVRLLLYYFRIEFIGGLCLDRAIAQGLDFLAYGL